MSAISERMNKGNVIDLGYVCTHVYRAMLEKHGFRCEGTLCYAPDEDTPGAQKVTLEEVHALRKGDFVEVMTGGPDVSTLAVVASPPSRGCTVWKKFVGRKLFNGAPCEEFECYMVIRIFRASTKAPPALLTEKTINENSSKAPSFIDVPMVKPSSIVYLVFLKAEGADNLHGVFSNRVAALNSVEGLGEQDYVLMRKHIIGG